MLAMGWPGQFNLDSFGFLLLSGIWTVWRNGFSGKGMALGPLAAFGCLLLLAIYLLGLSFETDGDIRKTLLGVREISA